MTTTVLEEIGELLSEVGAAGAFTAQQTADADDLHLEVKGHGPDATAAGCATRTTSGMKTTIPRRRTTRTRTSSKSS